MNMNMYVFINMDMCICLFIYVISNYVLYEKDRKKYVKYESEYVCKYLC